jgi:hypothetical protein
VRRIAKFTCRVPASIVALGAVAILLMASVVTPGQAAAQPAQRAHASLPAAVTETAKVTLDETSIAGPGLIGGAIAWTGTDVPHHLNVRTGTSDLSFPNKTTFDETSPFGTAIAMLPTPGGSQPIFALAWTGTDANHSLNVEEEGGTKLTLNENSIDAPALAFGNINGTAMLVLSWTGTDANHSLNVLPITGPANNLTPGTKTILSQFSSDAGPGLFANLVGGGNPPNGFVLGWSTSATQQLNLAESTDAVHFTSALGSGLPQTSAAAPQLIQSSASNACIAWTGTDAAQHLNVQCTTQFPQFPDPADTKTVLDETALGVPGFTGTSATTANIAWTGNNLDTAHHLNVASLQGL